MVNPLLKEKRFFSTVSDFTQLILHYQLCDSFQSSIAIYIMAPRFNFLLYHPRCSTKMASQSIPSKHLLLAIIILILLFTEGVIESTTEEDVFSKSISQLTQITAELDKELSKVEANRDSCSKPFAASEIVHLFFPIAQEKFKVGRSDEAFHDLDFLTRLVAENVEAINRGKACHSSDSIASPNLSLVQVRDGNFFIGDKPVTFIGPMGYAQLSSQLESVPALGFNIVGDDYDSYASLSLINESYQYNKSNISSLEASWKRLNDNRLAISFNPTLHYFPEWALKRFPDITGGDIVDTLPDWSGLDRSKNSKTKIYGAFFPFTTESSSLHQLVARYYDALSPVFNQASGFHLVWVMNEPTYKNTDSSYLDKYRQSLFQTYQSIQKLNQVWSTSYHNFSDIEPAFSEHDPGRYDWLVFHQTQLYEWFKWLRSEIKKHSPNTLISNKPQASKLLSPETGLDFEQGAELWDIPGFDASREPNNPDYAYKWREPIILLDFLKSVTPGKPLADLEYHYVHQTPIPENYVKATYWHSYFHGLRLSTFWVWDKGIINNENDPTPSGMSDTAWSQPDVAWATATTAMDLRRLAAQIALFPTRPQVAIYLSKPSLFLDGDLHRKTLITVYDAANGLDAPLGFVTDKMAVEGKLKDFKLAIIPSARYASYETLEAFQQYAKQGGRILMVGKSFLFDPYRKDITGDKKIQLANNAFVEPISSEILSSVLDQAFSLAGVERPVRIKKADSGSAWPTELRCAADGSDTLCYVIGLRKESVEILLESTPPIVAYEDLITGEVKQGNKMEVHPLDVHLIRLRFEQNTSTLDSHKYLRKSSFLNP